MKLRSALLIAVSLLLLIATVSALGGNWTEINSSAAFPQRYQHSSVVFNNNMWVIGGNDGGYRNDTWSSPDGNLWSESNASAEFPARLAHTSVVFNNRMWVIGGLSGGLLKNDVWNSTDGVLWAEATPAAAFPARNAHTSVVFGNRMWVIGGEDSGGKRQDVWNSSDGITWEEANATAGFSPRSGHSSLNFSNRIWVIGGNDGAAKNDVWYSPDGIVWTRATPAAAFPARYMHSSVVYDNRMWVIGGLGGAGTLNDVWSSSDGITWTRASATLPAPAREGHSSVVSGSKMWIIGGFDGTANKNDTWASLIPPVPGFSASPVSGYAPLNVTFTDTSTEFPVSWSWAFGDGGTSASRNPVHTFSGAGIYTVALTATNSEGSVTETKAQFITVSALVSSAGSGGDSSPSGPPVVYSPMESTVNVGGNSAVTRVAVSGTGLEDLIVTGLVQAPGIPQPPGILYQYVDLVPARYATITGSEIFFSVPVPWLEEHRIAANDLVMYRYSRSVWEPLPTTVLTKDTGFVRFSAKSPGFSLFAIAGKPGVLNSSNPAETSGSQPVTRQRSPVAASPTVAKTVSASVMEPVPGSSGFSPVIIIAAGIICAGLLAGGLMVRRWWIARQNPALFRKYR